MFLLVTKLLLLSASKVRPSSLLTIHFISLLYLRPTAFNACGSQWVLHRYLSINIYGSFYGHIPIAGMDLGMRCPVYYWIVFSSWWIGHSHLPSTSLQFHFNTLFHLLSYAASQLPAGSTVDCSAASPATQKRKSYAASQLPRPDSTFQKFQLVETFGKSLQVSVYCNATQN